MTRHLTIVGILLATFGRCAGAGAVPYTFTNLGPLVGGDFSRALGINDRGEIVGIIQRNGLEAWVYSGGQVTRLGKLGSDNGSAERINDAGQVMLNAQYFDGRSQVYVHSGGRTTQVQTPGYSHAFAIDQNEAGVIVGYVNVGQSPRAAILGPTGGVRLLGGLTANSASDALGINDRGQIVGIYTTNIVMPGGGAASHAFIYENGVTTDIGTLGGFEARARDINDKGQVVGQSQLANNTVPRAFIYENGQMRALPLLGTSQFSAADAFGINERGQVVGYSEGIGRGRRAVLWEDGEVIDLNVYAPDLPAGWRLEEATDINEEGDIVGWGITTDFQAFAFVLDAPELPPAVPLPAMVVPGAVMGVWVVARGRGRGRFC
jgi:probable HAF family extracellular repeat protein